MSHFRPNGVSPVTISPITFPMALPRFFRGIAPFLIPNFIRLAVLVLFPPIALVRPEVMP